MIMAVGGINTVKILEAGITEEAQEAEGITEEAEGITGTITVILKRGIKISSNCSTYTTNFKKNLVS